MRCGEWVGRVGGVMMVVMAVGGCKDRASTPEMVQVPAVATTEATSQAAGGAATEAGADVADIKALPELGQATVAKDAEGSLWQKYGSGLMVQDLKIGKGRVPEVGRTVWLSGEGTIAGTGRVFARYTSEKPLSFRMGSIHGLVGLEEAVVTMKPGGRRRVMIPAELAYGAAGDAELQIGANEALLYEVELTSVTGEGVKLPEAGGAKSAKDLVDQVVGPLLPATKPGK